MWPGPRPTSVPSSVLIHPTVWPQYTNITDRTDNALSDSIGRTVLQTVAQKSATFRVWDRVSDGSTLILEIADFLYNKGIIFAPKTSSVHSAVSTEHGIQTNKWETYLMVRGTSA